MKVAENLSILYFLEYKEKTKDGKTPIYIRITLSGERKEFSTGMKTDPALWNSTLNRVTGKTPVILAINNRLTQAQANLEKQYLILTTQYEYVTAELLKKAYKGEYNKPEPEVEKIKEKTLCQVCNYKYSIFARQVKRKIRSGTTLKRWRSTKMKIRKFLKHSFGLWDIPLSALKFRHAGDFLNYLTLEEGLQENTARKYVKNVKTLLELAESKEWVPKSPWDKYSIGYDQPSRDVLDIMDIITLNNHSFIERLEYVRDTFLFACFTGYAFNELQHFSKQDIFRGDDGMRWIKIDRKKTGKPEALPLLPIPAAIVDKYAGDPYCLKHGKLLPVRSLTHYNGYLREIGSICGIRLELTSHLARHTFATTVCLDNDVPIETVSRMLGHSNIRTTQIYAKVSRRKISSNMAELREKLFSFEGRLMQPNNLTIVLPEESLKRLAS